jgi:uncharacterized membrane protein (UPF0182 family)
VRVEPRLRRMASAVDDRFGAAEAAKNAAKKVFQPSMSEISSADGSGGSDHQETAPQDGAKGRR